MTSPLFANTEQDYEQVENSEMKCCAMSDLNSHHGDGMKDCHPDGKENKGKCGHDCPMKDCKAQLVLTVQTLLTQESDQEKNEILSYQISKDSFYLSLLDKDLTHSIWHPPQQLS